MPHARISAEDAKILIDTREVSVVDVRDARSFERGHIAGAIHLDNNGVQPFIDQADKSVALIVCCYHGNVSQSASAFLAEQGFTEVYSLDGGYTQWALQHPGDCTH